MTILTNHKSLSTSARQRRQGEQGYVLVFLILMVALVMVSFASIIPKVRFEAQRDREAELYFRGLQYQRAIQLYFRKFGSYPTSIDQLEKSNGIRFLRKRYADPISLKKEWRLIHVGPNGQFVDAKTTITAPSGPGVPAGSSATQSTSTTGVQSGVGTGQTPGQSTGFGLSPSPSTFGGSGSNPAGQANNQPGTGFGNSSNNPATTPSANPSADPTQTRGQTGGQQTPGASNPVGGTTSNTPSSNTLSSSQSGSNPVYGGGAIAGVASLSEDSSIRLVKTYDEYDKWEFIYDYRSDPVAMSKVANTAGGQPAAQPPGINPGGAPTGTPNVVPPGLFPPNTGNPSPSNPPNPFGPGGFPPPRTR